jgi:hypothetical protein
MWVLAASGPREYDDYVLNLDLLARERMRGFVMYIPMIYQ